ncbi:MAG: M48 family metalloprotease [Candidatus Eremiobacteraeota bacterium]|nr:M48 family metalloprotease [Candidatus Eremiobacteraeota bacterium]
MLAATEGPTGLDRRVTAIPAARILSQSPLHLVDPGRQRAAQYLVHFTRPLWLLWTFAQILVLLYLWRSGKAARLRERLRRISPNKLMLRFLFGATLALLTQIATLPAAFFDYRLFRIVGLSTETFGNWVLDNLISYALTMLLVGIIVAAVLTLVDRTHLWYAYVIAGVFAIAFFLSFVNPIVIEPLFNRYTPMREDQPLARRLRTLCERVGLGDLPIYVTDLSRRTITGNAYVVGLGSSRRIVLGDTLLRTATADEVVFTLAHELGHQVHRDVWRGTILGAFVFIFGAAIAVLIADRIGFRRDDDALSRLALVGSLLLMVFVILMPLVNGFSRTMEASADRFALQVDPDPVAGARMFIRFADDGMALVCPSRLVRIYFYDHPPLGSRIAALTGQPNPCP